MSPKPALLAQIIVLVLLFAAPARSEGSFAELPAYSPTHPVEIPPIGPFYGVRLRGLGGAYTAVAEGSEGTLTSLASLANRRPDEDGYLHWSGTFSWLFPAGDIDISNTGRATPAGFRLLAAGGLIRFGRLGFGIFIESMGITGLGGVGKGASMSRAVAGAAYALPGDVWIMGAGLHSVGYRLSLPGASPVEGSSPHLGFDVLYRPPEQNYRLGVSVKQAGRASLPPIPEVVVPPAVVRPWEISAGMALWLGDGALNRPLPVHDDSHPMEPAVMGLLLSADIFILGPPNGKNNPVAGLEAYFEDKLQAARQTATLGIRMGGETEAIRDRMRMRGGFWLEPSRFPNVGRRLHWTGGLDLYLFELADYRFRASMVFDLAVQYRIAGLSLGLW